MCACAAALLGDTLPLAESTVPNLWYVQFLSALIMHVKLFLFLFSEFRG